MPELDCYKTCCTVKDPVARRNCFVACKKKYNPDNTTGQSGGGGVDMTLEEARAYQQQNATQPTSNIETDILKAVNEQRLSGASCGGIPMPSVSPLIENQLLNSVAKAHSEDMVQRNYFSHDNPDGLSFSARMTNAGYKWSSAAENIADGQRTVDEVMQGWMNSPGHCKNIMKADVGELGVGRSGNKWTQVFGMPIGGIQTPAIETRMLAPPKSLELITLPINFHLMKSFKMKKNGLSMDVWVKCNQVFSVILPAINQIWMQASVAFVPGKGCHNYNISPSAREILALQVLEQSDRTQEEIDPTLNQLRKDSIRQLTLGVGISIPNSINVFLIPYMGKTRQGNAVGGDTTVCVGVWSDKTTQNIERTLLTEPGRFQRGSLSRTIAHEIGHCLDLSHPNNNKPSLMGEGSYTINSNDIATARRKALFYRAAMSGRG